MTVFPNTTELNLKEKVSQLGGLTNSMKKFGMESIMERNRKTQDQHFSTYSQFMSRSLGTSNTNNFVVDPPPVEVKQ
jgi:hypothetical protein